RRPAETSRVNEAKLHEAIQAFHTAIQRRDGVEARVRRGEHDPDLLDRSLLAAEAVVQARIALFFLLMDEGWTPPPTVTRTIELDGKILRQQAEHLI
ncbi:MAG: hypothetical protein JWO12_236, partial [Frankiales bacterium]|nr:hypothetical protein [Frankiales bacterium]